MLPLGPFIFLSTFDNNNDNNNNEQQQSVCFFSLFDSPSLEVRIETTTTPLMKEIET
jgi:hypothetical protein